MENVKSKVNPLLTLKYMLEEEENKYFDRKSAQIKPSEIADLISAFANAEGGTIVIGISDKTKEVEGLSICDDTKINEFINAPKSGCKPMPGYDVEFLNLKKNDIIVITGGFPNNSATKKTNFMKIEEI